MKDKASFKKLATAVILNGVNEYAKGREGFDEFLNSCRLKYWCDIVGISTEDVRSRARVLRKNRESLRRSRSGPRRPLCLKRGDKIDE